MDCRVFRKQHAAFVDDVLPGVQAMAMRRHLQSCDACAALDARIRRAVLLMRNLPQIEPSAAFEERLRQRLTSERSRGRDSSPVCRPGAGVIVAYSLGLASVAAIALLATSRSHDPPTIPQLPAVVALPPAELDSTTAPAIVASMSGGMPMWPALWLAEQASLRYARVRSQPVTYSPSR